jgi:hypothetical protein
MAPLHTDTDTTSENGKSTLEELGILKEGFVEDDIPPELLHLFLLVRNVEHIRREGFLGYKKSEESSINQRNRAAHDYDKNLMKRAVRLYRRCNDPKRENNTENEWMALLTRGVFYRFDREEEETARCHHWYEFSSRPARTDLLQLCLPPSLSAGKPADDQ